MPGTSIIGIALLIIMVIPIAIFSIEFSNSCYSKISDNSMLKVFFNRGLYGEFLTVKAVEGISDNERIVTNVYLEKARTASETTEVDVVYINGSGIYVLESKNYSGWIYGKENDKNWTQVLNKNTKNRFYNPIKQNAGHISAIEKSLGEEYKGLCRNIVVFSSRCTLKDVTVLSPDVKVIKRDCLRQIVKECSISEKLNNLQIDNIANKMSSFANADKSTKKAHIETIKAHEMVDSERKNAALKVEASDTIAKDSDGTEINNASPLCPKCGAPMVLRTASKGENVDKKFWGCSDFPKCRGIENIKE